MNRPLFPALLATLLLFVAGSLAPTPARAELKVVKKPTSNAKAGGNVLNGTAPGFEVMTLGLNKKKLSSDDLYGKKQVVLSFWATWCGPCKQEMPVLNELYKQYGDQVQFLGVSLDKIKDPRKDLEKIHATIDKLGLEYPMAHDSEDVFTERFNIESIPKTVFIDLKGNIAHTEVGFEDAAKLREVFKKSLVLKPPKSA